jgi:cellulose synthase/poly-beta-1,6-N-acetylglucosamine synthase-like glycosyltransferase
MGAFIGLGIAAGNFLDFSTGFFWTANSFFLFLLVNAWRSFRIRKRTLAEVCRKIDDYGSTGAQDRVPPVSILIPAHNEETVVLESVSAFLQIRYACYEVIVINDGSEDATLENLKRHFALEPDKATRSLHLSTSPVTAIYRSKSDPRLVVIDKPNTGKADSLNLGIDHARYGLFCAVDADSIPEVDCLAKTVIPFIEALDRTIVSGGSVRVFNGCQLKDHKIVNENLPGSWLGMFQVIEYVRSFFCARVGWNFLNATILISGAFGLFSRKAVAEAGGYLTESVSEDLELIVRLHRIHREKGVPYSISFVPDPVCWTLVPEKFHSLYEQRRRWQRGLVETLFSNLGMLFNAKYGALGWLAIPYYLLVEVFGPVIETATYLCFFLAYFVGFMKLDNFLIFMLASLGYGTLLTLASVWLEGKYHSTHRPNRSL